jgi:23S rRNA pseudouridine1911/1915/1917 synthase
MLAECWSDTERAKARCFSSCDTPMEKTLRLVVSEDGQRVDKYVAERSAELSRSRVQQLIDEGLLTVNGEAAKASRRLERGDEVVVHVPADSEPQLLAQPLPLVVVYEDADLLVVDKPAGLVVHPAPGHSRGTLVNALLARYPDLPVDQGRRPGMVHRLDKDTSGLIIVAKNEDARRYLQRQFKEAKVRKVYLALVEGRMEPEQGIIDAPLGRDPKSRKRMAVRPGGRAAVTEYRVLDQFEEQTLLEVRPRTGRTHQVRVHLAFVGHPVVGDRTYGYRKQRLGTERQFLHAHRLGFRLPSTGKPIELVSELPQDLSVVLDSLRNPSLLSAEDWQCGGR